MDLKNISNITQKLIEGCIIETESGIKIYTPDGKGNYKALWTRDFAYMLEYAGEFIPTHDIKNCIMYILDHVDVDGWIPDRVDHKGQGFYTAGMNFPARRNLDNAPFIIIAADLYLERIDESEAKEFFMKYRDVLCTGIDILPVSDNGIIYNNPEDPHSPYGFTDCICKTGFLSMETLLLYRALKIMIKWLKKCNLDSHKYIKYCSSIEDNFLDIFTSENSMLIAATEDCMEIDIWASCYAISIGYPMPLRQKKCIAKWLIDNYNDIVFKGQIRHLPKERYWEKTFCEVEKGTYQNGAFWATATGWFYEAIVEHDNNLAYKTVEDALNSFDESGVFECININYSKLDTYVVSATNIYYICKKIAY